MSRVPPQSDVGVDVTELSPQSESTDVQTEAENAAYLPYSPIPNLATNVPVRQNSAYLPYSHIPYADIRRGVRSDAQMSCTETRF